MTDKKIPLIYGHNSVGVDRGIAIRIRTESDYISKLCKMFEQNFDARTNQLISAYNKVENIKDKLEELKRLLKTGAPQKDIDSLVSNLRANIKDAEDLI